MLEKLLDEKEVAKRLGLSVYWCRRARWAGNGPEFIKINGTVRYKPESLDKFIEARVRKSTSDSGVMR